MLTDTLRRLCLMSCFFGAVTAIIPHRGVKQMTGILCTCILCVCISEPFVGFDFDALSAGLAVYHENEKRLTENISETERNVERAVIAEEYASYILEKANESGAALISAEVRVRSANGIWVPWETYIEYKETGADIEIISEIIEAELGVPKERQNWRH